MSSVNGIQNSGIEALLAQQNQRSAVKPDTSDANAAEGLAAKLNSLYSSDGTNKATKAADLIKLLHARAEMKALTADDDSSDSDDSTTSALGTSTDQNGSSTDATSLLNNLSGSGNLYDGKI